MGIVIDPCDPRFRRRRTADPSEVERLAVERREVELPASMPEDDRDGGSAPRAVRPAAPLPNAAPSPGEAPVPGAPPAPPSLPSRRPGGRLRRERRSPA